LSLSRSSVEAESEEKGRANFVHEGEGQDRDDASELVLRDGLEVIEVDGAGAGHAVVRRTSEGMSRIVVVMGAMVTSPR
jgi:hypothetical protein